MRGKPDPRQVMFYAIDIEDRIRPDHPLRLIKAAVDAILAEMGPRFEAAYAAIKSFKRVPMRRIEMINPVTPTVSNPATQR